jgi:hypothetical protein
MGGKIAAQERERNGTSDAATRKEQKAKKTREERKRTVWLPLNLGMQWLVSEGLAKKIRNN